MCPTAVCVYVCERMVHLHAGWSGLCHSAQDELMSFLIPYNLLKSYLPLSPARIPDCLVSSVSLLMHLSLSLSPSFLLFLILCPVLSLSQSLILSKFSTVPGEKLVSTLQRGTLMVIGQYRVTPLFFDFLPWAVKGRQEKK